MIKKSSNIVSCYFCDYQTNPREKDTKRFVILSKTNTHWGICSNCIKSVVNQSISMLEDSFKDS